MHVLNIDMYQTLAFAVGVLFIGGFLKKKISILEKFCIPAPVIGGLIFALVSCLLYVFGIVEFNFDETLKNVCMVMFFTSVGFQANLKVLRAGGLSLVIFLACLFVLIVVQNLAAVGLSQVLDHTRRGGAEAPPLGQHVRSGGVSDSDSDGSGNGRFLGAFTDRNDVPGLHRLDDSCSFHAEHRRVHRFFPYPHG